MKLKPYKKEDDISYSLGLYPTIELLLHKATHVKQVIFADHARKRTDFVKLQELCAKHHVEMSFDPYQVEKISHKDNTDVIGVFAKYQMQLAENRNHILLYQPADIGNVGMIIRSAVGFDRPNIAVIGHGVDAFNPKVIRATMGAFFSCNIEYFPTLEDYTSQHINKLYAFDIKATKGLKELDADQPNAFLFGSEASGLPDQLLNQAELVKIEYNSQAIESLNLANAVSIVLYQYYIK